MIAEEVFHQLLNLGECWEVKAADYEAEANRFVIIIAETERLWPTLVCPRPECGERPITCYDHTDTRSWRHLDVFGKKSEILCAVRRSRCAACQHVSVSSLYPAAYSTGNVKEP